MRTEAEIREAVKHDEPSLRMLNATEKMKYQPFLYGWLEALEWVLNDKGEK
jgi:hypothetical protein